MMDMVALGGLAVVIGYVAVITYSVIIGLRRNAAGAKTTTPPATTTVIRPEVPSHTSRVVAMTKPWSSLYTADQLMCLFRAWNCTEPLPNKKAKVVVCFPPGRHVRSAEVTRTVLKSTYGKTLFQVVMQ